MANKHSDLGLNDGAGPGHEGDLVRLNPQTGKRNLDRLVWGLLPHDTADPHGVPRPIQARAETVVELPIFADAFRRRRAIAPADEYFQRRSIGRSRERWAISRADR